MRTARTSLFCLLFIACFSAGSQAQEEFSFDISEFEKSPFEFEGHVQVDASYLRLDRGSALYRLNFLDRDQDSRQLQGGLELQPELTWQDGSRKVYLLVNLTGSYSQEDWQDDFTLYQANFSRQVNPGTYISLGKTLVRWGKGYAWNPVNFAGRLKNPSDPDLALEGYWTGLVDMVRSFPGALRTVAVTGVIIPADGGVNPGLGEEGHTYIAGKVYALLYDTDIDLLFLSQGSRIKKYGLDFSRNITSNFEVHGEWATVTDFSKRVIAPDGTASVTTFDAVSTLVGVRYLAPTETTFILEYYRNGEGYTEREAEDFYEFIGQAGDTQLQNIRQTAGGYQRPNFMRRYAYLRVGQKEPFGLLYVTPALTSMVNLDDGSYTIIPEVAYTGVTNLELRLRLSVLSGDPGTEYGEKQNDWKMELRTRYFF